ncbi:MAG: hypothetical protein QOI66_1987 [Myxococcales bacterium]|nr:hypothetical protein [Myxococcales bacterium]
MANGFRLSILTTILVPILVPILFPILATVVVGCESKGPGRGPDGNDPPLVSGSVSATDNCSYGFEAPEPKFDPQLSQVFESDPAARRVFVVLVKHVELTPVADCMSCNGCRSCPERDAALADLMHKVEESQKCATAFITATGGEFLESFWIGNSVLARLTREQALKVASIADVQHLDDGDAPGTPPP